MPVIPFQEHTPKLHESIFLAPDAWITGKVTIAKDCSIFFGAVLRGDIQKIVIGEGTNIQEHCLLHSSQGLTDCIVGDFVTVGHRAIVHGASVGSYCIVGMGSTLLDGVKIGERSIIGANSLVTMNKEFPPGSLILGNPAKVVRSLTDAETEEIKNSANHYITVGKTYQNYFLTAR